MLVVSCTRSLPLSERLHRKYAPGAGLQDDQSHTNHQNRRIPPVPPAKDATDLAWTKDKFQYFDGLQFVSLPNPAVLPWREVGVAVRDVVGSPIHEVLAAQTRLQNVCPPVSTQW